MKSREHPDYQKNLEYAEALSKAEDTGHKLLNGLRVKVSNGEHIPKALLMISWSPGMTCKRGNYATPVFLHQYSGDFQKTSTNVLNFYKKTIQEAERDGSCRPELLDPNLKV